MAAMRTSCAAVLLPCGSVLLAGVDAVVGLYAVIGATIGHPVFGSVRTMSVGPEGTIALLAATIVAPLAAGDPSTYLALMGALALLTGAWLILAGLLRLGFVTRFLSRPLLSGFVAGSAIVMIVSQLPELLGITLQTEGGTLAEIIEIVEDLSQTDPLDLMVGIVTIAVTLVVREIRPCPATRTHADALP
jgi:MFS superfamily sulfate permease-like transporter